MYTAVALRGRRPRRHKRGHHRTRGHRCWTTNHRCIWHRLDAICDASSDCELWAPSLGKGWS